MWDHRILIHTDEYYMELALAQARLAWDLGEVPVGAIVINDAGEIVGEGCNRTLSSHDPSAHAEMMALRTTALNLKNYRLPNLTMYVTLEPCTMCAGLLIHARLKKLVFGAYDPRTGACGSLYDLPSDPRHNHHFEIQGGVLEKKCGQILKDFFKLRRKQIKESKSKRIAVTLGLQEASPSDI